ncbi:hypothetical protein [Methanobrevibacter sp.]|uniref:hypothetical protein n=1 Tax=Methanobrevibacter sp. TaxID=66852 RepID=UPI0025FCCB02|nr:hypothetical protein [Methanobrevibacter sp.]MBQ2832235.1 hypothetical protein [Methanobrevibacter sp.]
MSNQKRTENPRKFVFGNERFGGSYTPGEFEFNFPEDMSREEFEKMFSRRMNALHRRGNDFAEEFFDFDKKSKKEKLKPLSIRVKSHTKEFFKNHSILSPRDVLEMYENFNNGSEAFINSLIEDEKNLQKELDDVQERLHNAKLFKEKLGEMEPKMDVLTDQDKILKLKQEYESSEIKAIGNETSIGKAKNNIIRDIQIYNTLIIRVYSDEVLSIGVYTNAEPIVYYFKNEYSREDISEILKEIEEFCSENEIQFQAIDSSIFGD